MLAILVLIAVLTVGVIPETERNDNPPPEITSLFYWKEAVEVAYVQLRNNGETLYVSMLFYEPDYYVITYIRQLPNGKWNYKIDDIQEVLKVQDGKAITIWARSPPAPAENRRGILLNKKLRQ